MVLFIEACESGSIFQGMLDDSLANVWATTAANAMESSWGVYCPGQTPGPPIEFNTCLGDLYRYCPSLKTSGRMFKALNSLYFSRPVCSVREVSPAHTLHTFTDKE